MPTQEQVLYIDINGERLRVVEYHLRHKYSVTTLQSIARAISLLTSRTFDLVIATHTIHRSGDGLKLLSDLRQDGQRVLLMKNTELNVPIPHDMPCVSITRLYSTTSAEDLQRVVAKLM